MRDSRLCSDITLSTFSKQAKHFLQQEHPVGSTPLSHSQDFNSVHLETMEAQMASLHVVLLSTRPKEAKPHSISRIMLFLVCYV